MSTGRKLIERVARLKLTADGPNGLALGRLMRDSSFEDVLARSAPRRSSIRPSRPGGRDDELQMILGFGLTIGLVFAFLQIWPEVIVHFGYPKTGSNLFISMLIGAFFSSIPALLVFRNRRRR